MTAPQQPPPPPQDPVAAQAATAAALTVALLALETRVRADIATAIATILAAWVTLVIAIITAGRVRTGTELLSRDDVHAGLTRSLTAGRAAVTSTVRSGYTAAGALAWAQARRDLRALGHELPEQPPPEGDALDRLVDDVATAFDDALPDAQNAVREAFDGVTGDDPSPARVLVVHQAVERFAARLRARTTAAAVVGVYQGAADAHLAAYAHFADTNPYVVVRKRWVVTADDPCGMCAALHGSTIALDAEFDHTANTGTGRLVAVWGDLQAPPRHPNCRCHLELVTTR